ncbi:MAG: isocitrate lyase family protein [Planctomycetes bacterium]|nr:isocitrate lyase family protein [Planctomycetota bacterium]
MSTFDEEVAETQRWFDAPRFKGITRLHTARQVVAQRGTIRSDYRVAREAAEAFYARLRELFEARKAVTTFGPYSPGQAVSMKRAGIEGIYLGGWATSAKGSLDEDPGPDLASYPLSQVPNEAAGIVRALITADRNQRFARSRMTPKQLASTPEVDFRPFIIADADTGHGGEPHVRNLVRRFVEVGVPGYHLEDQRPGTKKCGHQGGKVLVASDEQIKRLNAARFQLDVMGVSGLIVARTDAEAANLLDGRGDERDQPFILGSTNIEPPTYKVAFLALLRKLHALGIAELNGFLLYAVSEGEYKHAEAWLDRAELTPALHEAAKAYTSGKNTNADALLDGVLTRFIDAWQAAAGLSTYGEAVAELMEFRRNEGETFSMSLEEWKAFAKHASFHEARQRAKSLGLGVIWDCEHAKTPEGYYQVRGGLEYAIAKSLAAAPYADLVWMETKTADLKDATEFAHAVHARFPDKMIAYNLSPSFSWDTTGMTEEEMRAFPAELGKLGSVFNFITYGGHQIDGLAGEEFAAALQQEGMLALAQLQRKFRLVESPYRTPQTLVGGPRADEALAAASGRTATTRAMGQGSTQFQHLVQVEVPPKVLEEWLGLWTLHHKRSGMRVELRPYRAGSALLELKVLDGTGTRVGAVAAGAAGAKLANVIFGTIQDRNGRNILSVRDQNTFDESLRRKRLMTLLHLFLLHRYKIAAVHYVTPTEDNQQQSAHMKALGIYAEVAEEVGEIIVADVNAARVQELIEPGRGLIGKLIEKTL